MSDPVTAPTPDAVAQARKKYDATLPELDFAYRHLGPSEIAAAEENTECAWAEVLAAVRAECAAKVRGVVEAQRIGTNPDDRDTDIAYDSAISDVLRALTALEAHP